MFGYCSRERDVVCKCILGVVQVYVRCCVSLIDKYFERPKGEFRMFQTQTELNFPGGEAGQPSAALAESTECMAVILLIYIS